MHPRLTTGPAAGRKNSTENNRFRLWIHISNPVHPEHLIQIEPELLIGGNSQIAQNKEFSITMSSLLFNNNAKWLWWSRKTTSDPHQYVYFRKEFEVSETELLPRPIFNFRRHGFHRVSQWRGIRPGEGNFPTIPGIKLIRFSICLNLKAAKNTITVLGILLRKRHSGLCGPDKPE